MDKLDTAHIPYHRKEKIVKASWAQPQKFSKKLLMISECLQ